MNLSPEVSFLTENEMSMQRDTQVFDLIQREVERQRSGIELIASEMRKQGLDPTNEENFDSYLNSKIM